MPWKESITPRDVCNLLNEALARDRRAITTLVHNRASCNSSLANHDTIQVRHHKAGDHTVYTIGLIGLLNGMFGVNEDSEGCLEIVFEKDGQDWDEIVRFDVKEPAPKDTPKDAPKES